MWVLPLSSHAVLFTGRLFFAKRCLVARASPVCLLTHPLKDSWVVYLGVKLLSVFTEFCVCESRPLFLLGTYVGGRLPACVVSVGLSL